MVHTCTVCGSRGNPSGWEPPSFRGCTWGQRTGFGRWTAWQTGSRASRGYATAWPKCPNPTAGRSPSENPRLEIIQLFSFLAEVRFFETWPTDGCWVKSPLWHSTYPSSDRVWWGQARRRGPFWSPSRSESFKEISKSKVVKNQNKYGWNSSSLLGLEVSHVLFYIHTEKKQPFIHSKPWFVGTFSSYSSKPVNLFSFWGFETNATQQLASFFAQCFVLIDFYQGE